MYSISIKVNLVKSIIAAAAAAAASAAAVPPPPRQAVFEAWRRSVPRPLIQPLAIGAAPLFISNTVNTDLPHNPRLCLFIFHPKASVFPGELGAL